MRRDHLDPLPATDERATDTIFQKLRMNTESRASARICIVVAMLATLPLAVEAASRQAEAREQLRQIYAADEPGAVAVARLLVHFSEGEPPTVLEPVAE